MIATVLSRRREVFGSDPEEILSIIRWAKESAGLSDVALAQRLGVATTTVQEYRIGKRMQRPGWTFCVRWLQACGCRLVIDG